MGKSDSRTLLRVLPVGDFPANAEIPAMSDDEHRFVYRAMLRVRLLDEKMLLMQRQGRIAFFGPSSGQEASICGSGFVARKQDWLFPALREGGALLMRGFPLERYFGQLFGNVLDFGRFVMEHFVHMHSCSPGRENSAATSSASASASLSLMATSFTSTTPQVHSPQAGTPG